MASLTIFGSHTIPATTFKVNSLFDKNAKFSGDEIKAVYLANRRKVFETMNARLLEFSASSNMTVDNSFSLDEFVNYLLNRVSDFSKKSPKKIKRSLGGYFNYMFKAVRDFDFKGKITNLTDDFITYDVDWQIAKVIKAIEREYYETVYENKTQGMSKDTQEEFRKFIEYMMRRDFTYENTINVQSSVGHVLSDIINPWIDLCGREVSYPESIPFCVTEPSTDDVVKNKYGSSFHHLIYGLCFKYERYVTALIEGYGDEIFKGLDKCTKVTIFELNDYIDLNKKNKLDALCVYADHMRALYYYAKIIALAYVESINGLLWDVIKAALGMCELDYGEIEMISTYYPVVDPNVNLTTFRNNSLEDFSPGSVDPASTNATHLNDIDEHYKAKYVKLQKLSQDVMRVKPAKLKQKLAAGFFKKWYGRIPSMLSRYGGEATVFENRMRGDPTDVLLSSGVEYLNNMTEFTNNLFTELLDIAKKVASAGDVTAKLNALKSFCKTYPIETGSEAKEIKTQVMNETCYRIAKCIMGDHGIYGYTPEGIVENKKFPTCNHIVVSLFIDNPHEEPQEISVSEIFHKPESLTIFAHPEKLLNFENSYKNSVNAIVQGFNSREMSQIDRNLKVGQKRLVNSLRNAKFRDAIEDGGDPKDLRKTSAAINDALVDSFDLVIEQKKRCIQVVGSMYDMSNRIMSLAKRAVAALHQVEKKHSDKRFKSGINNKSLDLSTFAANKTNQWNTPKQSDGTVKRAGSLF